MNDFTPIKVKSNFIKEIKKENRVKKYSLVSVISLVTIVTLVGVAVYKVNSFFESNKFVFQSPVKVAFEKPIYITHRDNTPIIQEVMASENVNPLTPDQQYLCNVFGKDCVTALAIFRAESGMNNKAINANKDGSVDFGCMQINSVHFKTIDVSKINLLNCQDNIDVAYKIFKQQGNFSAWVAYTNGSYKKYLIN